MSREPIDSRKGHMTIPTSIRPALPSWRAIAIGGALALAVLTFDAPTVAQAAWCASYRNGGNNCGFATFAQCQAAVSGVGGFCNSDGAAEKPVRRERETE